MKRLHFCGKKIGCVYVLINQRSDGA
jgi:hypothetical protein